MLPADDLVLAEIGDIRDAGLAAGLDNHPAHMGPEETVVGAVRVEVGVGITVVRTVTTSPPLDRALDGTCTGDGEGVFEGFGRVIRAVGPETVVTRGYACKRKSSMNW